MNTRKDFIMVANILNDVRGDLEPSLRANSVSVGVCEELLNKIVLKFVEHFKSDNPKFDEGVFSSACGVEL